MRQRALVMEVAGGRMIVMLSGGRFQRVRVREPVAVGQEIWMQTRPAQNFYPAVAAAAVFLIALGAFGPHLVAPAIPADAFSLDFSSSIDVGVSKHGQVVSVKSFNPSGAKLLNQASVMGMSATQAALTLTRIGVADHMVTSADPYVLVGGAVGAGSGAWFQAMTAAEVKLVHDRKWDIDVVVAETHTSAAQYTGLDTSIGRDLLNARAFASPLQTSTTAELASVLSRSGVLEASASAPP